VSLCSENMVVPKRWVYKLRNCYKFSFYLSIHHLFFISTCFHSSHSFPHCFLFFYPVLPFPSFLSFFLSSLLPYFTMLVISHKRMFLFFLPLYHLVGTWFPPQKTYSISTNRAACVTLKNQLLL